MRPVSNTSFKLRGVHRCLLQAWRVCALIQKQPNLTWSLLIVWPLLSSIIEGTFFWWTQLIDIGHRAPVSRLQQIPILTCSIFIKADERFETELDLSYMIFARCEILHGLAKSMQFRYGYRWTNPGVHFVYAWIREREMKFTIVVCEGWRDRRADMRHGMHEEIQHTWIRVLSTENRW